MAALMALPVSAFAAGSDDAMIQELQKQIQDLSSELEDLSDRLDDTERHTALDRINLSGDLRVKADTLQYKDVTFNPGIMVDYDNFTAKAMDPFNSYGFNTPLQDAGLNTLTFDETASPEAAALYAFMGENNTLTPLAKMMLANPNLQNAFFGGMLTGVGAYPFLIAPEVNDINNDILFTTRLRLDMKARVWDNVKFNGRLAMYKNWGDSTGSQVFDSWNGFTMDGTNGGNTTGDWLRVDRAFFDWSHIGGTPLYLSIGRRPSTNGPPTQYRENELRGGTPTGNVMDLNFDGITIGYHLEELTGVWGMVARFCYGQGFESEWGNGELFNEIETKDTHFAGFNFDFLNDGTNFVQATLFRAWDINDGFKGVIAFPTQYAEFFAPTLYQDMQKFPNFNFVTRVQPSTTIGDMDLGGIVFSREEENGIKWFTSGGITIMHPNGNAGMFGGMGTDAIYQAQLNADGTEIIMAPATAQESKDRTGYGFYAGVQFPAPKGKIGFEYNYGSEYWTPFTQSQDDVVGSKLATRGHVGEVYYIVDINPRMSFKLSGIYYDYIYSGSGSPVGKPHKIDDIQDGNVYSMLPVVDEAYDLNASMTINF
jgi:hypothetical protein